MVKVATRPADNPVGAMARKLHIGKDTWGKKNFNSTISQKFVTSTGNIEKDMRVFKCLGRPG